MTTTIRPTLAFKFRRTAAKTRKIAKPAENTPAACAAPPSAAETPVTLREEARRMAMKQF